jgi:hypothetical protein
MYGLGGEAPLICHLDGRKFQAKYQVKKKEEEVAVDK